MKATEAQLRLLDAAVRLSLENDGLLAFILQAKDEAIKQGSIAPASESAKYLGQAAAWQGFYDLILSIPDRLSKLDELRKQQQADLRRNPSAN